MGEAHHNKKISLSRHENSSLKQFFFIQVHSKRTNILKKKNEKCFVFISLKALSHGK